MKKSIFVASLLIAGVAMADSTEITCDNVLGVLPINVPSNRLEVILSVPWVQPGGGTDLIAVSNLVKTAGLEVGQGDFQTQLQWYSVDDNKFYSWYLTSGEAANYWSISGDENLSPDIARAKQGDALILSFTNATTAVSNIVYVVGQVGTNGTITTTIPGAKGSTPTYTLVAPPCGLVTAIDMNAFTLADDTIIDDGDEITTDVVNGLPARYVRKEVGGKKKWVFVYDPNAEAKIPAGRGFWYKRCAESALKISWSAQSM